MNNKALFISFIVLFFIGKSVFAQTIIEPDLYQKVFGKKQSSREIEIEFLSEGVTLGLVKTRVQGDTLLSIERSSLVSALQGKLDEEEILRITSINEDWISPSDIGFPVRYSPEVLGVIANIPLSKMNARERQLREISENQERAVYPAPFGGATTFRGEQYWADEKIGGNYFLGGFDSFVNAKGVVLENQTVYQSNLERKWFRGDTRLIKDFHKSMIRTQAGDINYQTIGFQTLRPMGGVNIGRNFFLNPYRTPYPKFNRDFIVKTRSKVTYFVNGAMIKSEFLVPGRYAVRDVPLTNGINNILVEIEDDLGRKEIVSFQQTTSINLLNEHESKFDLAVGYPFQDINQKRDYITDNNLLSSGFFQYGLTGTLTAAAYAQNYNDFNLAGLENILATNLGNFSLGAAYGGDKAYDGKVYNIGYNLAIVRQEWFSAHNLNIRHEIREGDFIQTWSSAPARIKNLTAANYSLPLFQTLTASIGGNYGKKNEDALADKYGFDASFTLRIYDNINATFYASRTRDEFKVESDLAYMLINITFPEKTQYVTAYADNSNQTRRLTYVKDNLNQLNTFKGQAVVETNKTSNIGDGDLVFNSKLADIGGHVTGFNYDNGDSAGRYSARINSSFVFAASEEGWSWAVSRPVQTSFALLTPNEHIEGQKFAVKSTSPFSEGISDFMGKTVFVNLLPYQYRELQLDPSNVDIGYSLGQENYVLFPTYRSAHLIFVGAPGKVTVKGVLQSPKGQETLRTGEIKGADGVSGLFFTNRKGQFLIENLMPGNYQLELSDERKIDFTIPENARGLFDIGILEIEPWEE